MSAVTEKKRNRKMTVFLGLKRICACLSLRTPLTASPVSRMWTIFLVVAVAVWGAASQAPGFVWSSSGTSLPTAAHLSSAANIAGLVLHVGGCLDVTCASTSPYVAVVNVATQSVFQVDITLPDHGVAGPYSTVSAPRRIGSARSAFVVRACSLCFTGHAGAFVPNRSTTATNHQNRFDSSAYFGTVMELSTRSSDSSSSGDSSGDSSGAGGVAFHLNASALQIPSLYARCNASCVAQGTHIYIIGGVSVATGEEVTAIDVIRAELLDAGPAAAFQPNVGSIPEDIAVFRMSSNASSSTVPPASPRNTMGTSFVCGLGGATSLVGVGSNNVALFLTVMCWDFEYPLPQATESYPAMLVAWYPPSTIHGNTQPLSTLLFANASLATAIAPPTTAALLPFASQLYCTGGYLLVAIGFVFNNQQYDKASARRVPSNENPVGHYFELDMSATESFGHESIFGQAQMSPTGAAWSLFTLAGLGASSQPQSTIQFGSTSIAVAAPLEAIVSRHYSNTSGLYDNSSFPQSDIGSIVMRVGEYITFRFSDLSPTALVSLSSTADCSVLLRGGEAKPMASIAVTFAAGEAADEVFMCISDGIVIFAGTDFDGEVFTTQYFSPINLGAALRVVNSSHSTTRAPATRAPPTSTVAPQSVAPTSRSPQTLTPATATQVPLTSSPSPVTKPWIPLWAEISGGVGVGVLLVAIVFVVLCKCTSVFRSKVVVSHRDLIALENITNSNKYTIVRRLGSGGNGEVFLVKRKKDGELCAIKHIRCRGNKSREDLFRESDVLNRLKGHPNMVEILEMSLHEVYVEEKDDDDSEYTDSDDDENVNTFAVSDKTDANARLLPTKESDARSNMSKKSRRRRRRSNLSLLGGESIASTGPMGSDRLAAINASLSVGLPQDASADHFGGVAATTGSDGEGAQFLSVRRRAKKATRRRSRPPTEGAPSATASDVPSKSKDESDATRGGSEWSGADESKRSAPLLGTDSATAFAKLGVAAARPGSSAGQPNAVQVKADSDLSASSYYQSINGDESRQASVVRRRVRYQCIVMKYFKKGDLASFIEQQLPLHHTVLVSHSASDQRRGSIFSSLLRKKSRDDVVSVGGLPAGKVGYESDATATKGRSSAHRSRCIDGAIAASRAKSPATSSVAGDALLEVPSTLPGGGSDSDDPSSQNHSDDDRNIAPAVEPIHTLERLGSVGNMSQASGLAGGSFAAKGHTAPPLREDMIASIVYQVAALLRYLHSRKPNRIVHCDIKPENILVAECIHPLYLQLLGGQAANAMHTANAASGRSPSRLFERYLSQPSAAYGSTATTALGSPASVASSARQGGQNKTANSKRTLHRGHDPQSSPYFVGQSQRSSLPNTPLTVGGQITAVGETIAAALEDVFLPVVVSDVGQAMEIPPEDGGALPPLPGAPPAQPHFYNNIRLEQCTMPYVSPECIASGLRCVSPALDVWALGCVLYSICTKRLKHTDVVVMFEEVRKPTFAADMRFELCDVLGYSQALVALLLAMLSPDPLQRPTAADITNHWMVFVPHLGQTVLPGVMKVQVSVPAAHAATVGGPASQAPSLASASRRLAAAQQ